MWWVVELALEGQGIRGREVRRKVRARKSEV